tara:strand:- start:263 stop:523 length:261 start_codon:yes stop_codon:yes gene_type:complete
MTLNKTLDCQTNFTLPVSQAREYQYGLLDNNISMNIPVNETDIKLQLNIEIDKIGGNIQKLSINRDSFEKEIKKFLIKELQDSLDD